MPQSQSGDVQIPIPFGALVKAIDQLPTESLVELLHVTEAVLSARTSQKFEERLIQVEDESFWENELGQYLAAEADSNVSIEEVRKALSAVPGSLAA
jgi:hypothetical protein